MTLFGIMESPWEVDFSDALQNGDENSGTTEPSVSLDGLYKVHGLSDGTSTHTRYDILRLAVYDESTNQYETIEVPQHSASHQLPDQHELTLSQHDGPVGSALIYKVGAGMTRKIDIGDLGGLAVQGQWTLSEDKTRMSWVAAGGAHVLWSEGSRVLCLTGEGYTSDELVALVSEVGP